MPRTCAARLKPTPPNGGIHVRLMKPEAGRPVKLETSERSY